MKIINVKVENGILKVPEDLKIPQGAKLSVLLTNENEKNITILDNNESFSFLKTEPDLYTDNDILKDRKNENFSN